MTRVALLLVACLFACARTPPPSTAVPAPTDALPYADAGSDPDAIAGHDHAPSSAAVDPPADPNADPKGDPLAPLSDDAVAILFGSPEDSAPEHRGGVTPDRENKHYVAGNEKTLDAFYETVKGIGGGYVGVGSDQAYLFIGWMRPKIAWLTDYDPDVVDVHEIYRLLILASETPDDMLALWDKPARAQVEALIRAEHQGRRAKHLEKLYATNRGWIARRLVAQRTHFDQVGIPSWLTDPDDYAYVRRMLQARRVRPLLANLLDARAVKGVAASARELGVAIRVLYLSNAEEYWPKYPQQYRDNLAALPFSDDALVLRTLLIWDVNEDYRYNIQRADNYLRWLARTFVRNVYDVVHARPKPSRDAVNLFETTGNPDESPAARRHAKTTAAAS